MKSNHSHIFIVGFRLLLLTGCASSPTFVNDNKSYTDAEKKSQFNAVHFKTSKQFISSPPQCIAILPFESNVHKVTRQSTERLILTAERRQQLRWILYSHLAPYSYRDIELKTVDKTLKDINKQNYASIGRKLKCDALLIGTVTDFDADFLGLYSQISIGINLRLIRSKDGKVLWQGQHVAESRDGSVPLTPVDIAVGVYSATENISDEQVVRVEDDLFRRLLSTWSLEHNTHPQQPSNETRVASAHESIFHVIAQKLFLRKGPGRKFKAEDVLDKNEQLVLLNTKYSPWVQVKVADGQLGYVHNKYIQASN